METFGQRLRRTRKSLGLSQDALAQACGLSQTTISDIERDRNETSRDATAIARALNVSPDWLADGIGSPDARPANIEPEARPPTVAEMLEALREKIVTLPEADRAFIAAQVSSYMMSPSADTGRAFAEAIAKILKR